MVGVWTPKYPSHIFVIWKPKYPPHIFVIWTPKYPPHIFVVKNNFVERNRDFHAQL